MKGGGGGGDGCGCGGGRGLVVVAALVVTLAGVLISWDPWKLSLLANDPSFEAKYIEEPKLDELRESIGTKDVQNQLSKAKRWPALMGPESLAFDTEGRGPYSGVADGRIMKWESEKQEWVEFAHTSPFRYEPECEPAADKSLPHIAKNEHRCGRPLGLRFDPVSGHLLIADAYFGLMSVGPGGGQAVKLSSEPVNFANDLAVAPDGAVYFTDSSSKYQRRNFFLLVLSGDDSGRVLKYDPSSGTTTTIIRGLQFPNGVALSSDSSFLVIAESVPGRLLRHWLKGPKVGTTEVMAVLPGYPDNVRTNEHGEFWVAMHCRRQWIKSVLNVLPWLRQAILQFPIPFKYLYRFFNGAPHGMLAKYNAQGQLLEILEDVDGSVVKYASEVDERPNGSLYIGSVLLPYISVYDRSS